VSSHLHAPAILPPGKQAPLPFWQSDGWDSDPVCKRWRREKITVSAGNWNPIVHPIA